MRRFWGAAASLALACSSGGGGGDGGTAEITVATATLLTSQVLLALDQSAELSTIVEDFQLDAVEPALAAAAAGSGGSRTLAGSAGVAPSGAFGPITELCGAPGSSVRISGFQQSPPASSAGDSFEFTFVDCDLYTPGQRLDGLFAFRIVAASGSRANGLFDELLAVTFTDFRTRTGNSQTAVNGSATARFNSTTQPLQSSSIRGSLLLLGFDPDTQQSGEAGESSLTLRDYATSLLQNAGDDTLSGNGLLAGSQFSGDLLYSVVDLPEDPSLEEGEFIVGGELLISGAGDATIRLVEAPAQGVELELRIDLDGDGNADVTLPTTWSALGL